MAVSESKKKANMKWDSANMATLACKVKREQAEQFRAYCADKDETVNAVLQSYVFNCVNGISCNPTQNTAESPGSVITPSSLKTAQEAAQKAKESVPEFIERAVTTQSERDRRARMFGTGE